MHDARVLHRSAIFRRAEGGDILMWLVTMEMRNKQKYAIEGLQDFVVFKVRRIR